MLARRDRRPRRLGGRRRFEHGAEQAREAVFEILAAKPVELRRALLALLDQARLAEHAKVVGEGRLREAELEAAAALRAVHLGELADDAEPLRIAERVQHRDQLEL